MNTSIDRFRKLNSVLGWGNPEAKIIYIGIEEAGDWSILNLLDSFEKKKILGEEEVKKIKGLLEKEKISLDKYYTVVDLILKYINSNGLLDCLDEYIEYYTSSVNASGIRITDDNESFDLCRLENFQYYVTQKIIEKDFSYNVCKYNYDHAYFGTPKGNELCLNYYPIGRTNMNVNYTEYNEFFGLEGQDRFPSLDFENDRKGSIKKLLIELSNTSEKYIVLTLGEQTTFKNLFTELFSDLTDVKSIDFDKKGRGQSYYFYKIKNVKIFNTNHPSYNWISYEQIDEILNKYL